MVMTYPDGQYGAISEWLINPAWKEIETAIRKLDRLYYPFIWLYIDPNADDNEQPDIEVVGGNGVYAIQSCINGKTWTYYDPSKGDKDIIVWESDQGASLPESKTCSDLQIVLRIIEYFCETGRLHEEYEWRNIR
jgi:hypothetical protein